MSQCLLAQGVYLCFTDDAAVFLDLKRDKYIGLGANQVPALREALASKNIEESGLLEFFGKLQGHRLVELGDFSKEGSRLASIEAAKSPLVEIDTDGRAFDSQAIKFHHVLALMLAYLRATVNFRWGSLERSIARVRHLKRRNNAVAFDLQAARELMHIYSRLQPLLYARHNRCLFDSLTLIEFMASHGVFPTWVLGVRTGPFLAHAWVQQEGYVFNDSPEIVASYTPIIAI